MPSAASFTFEQPIQQPYQMPNAASFTQMPTTASFTSEQPAQPYSYHQQYAATQSPYTFPQQQSFAAYPLQANYPSMGGIPQFQFYQEGRASLGAEVPSRPIESMNDTATGPGRANSPMRGRSKSPMNKPNSSTSHRPPAKKTEKKTKGCCSC